MPQHCSKIGNTALHTKCTGVRILQLVGCCCFCVRFSFCCFPHGGFCYCDAGEALTQNMNLPFLMWIKGGKNPLIIKSKQEQIAVMLHCIWGLGILIFMKPLSFTKTSTGAAALLWRFCQVLFVKCINVSFISTWSDWIPKQKLALWVVLPPRENSSGYLSSS